MTVNQKVAGSMPVADGFSACTLLTYSCGLCGYLGKKAEEGVKLERNLRKVRWKLTPLSMY